MIFRFAFNVDNYKAVVQPFLRRGEVMTWSKFIWELEQHAAWSLTFNNAAKQINRLGRIFSFGNVALSGEQKEQLVMDESSHGVEDPNVELLLGKLPGVKKNNEK